MNNKVHVKQSTLDPKVPFLVYTMLSFIFLIRSRRQAKRVLLCISFLWSILLFITSHRFAKNTSYLSGFECLLRSVHMLQGFLRLSRWVSSSFPVQTSSWDGGGSFCPTGTFLEWCNLCCAHHWALSLVEINANIEFVSTWKQYLS